jgi:hypothetical protein
MKLKSIFQIQLFVLLFVACTPEGSVNPEEEYTYRLWKRNHLSIITDSIPYCFDLFKYDSLNRIEKSWPCISNYSDTISSIVYLSFGYNEMNQLGYQLTHNFCGEQVGWIIADSTCFLYRDNLLISEETYYPNTNDVPYIFTYEYDNKLKIRKYLHRNNLLKYWISYEYFEQQCTKETMYDDSAGLSSVNYTTHEYIKGLKIRSESHFSDNNKIFQTINYTYDKGNKLIMEESIVDSEIQYPLPYIYRYEYEKIPK